MRLDKYLKVTRLIKRRTVANEACDEGRVTVNGRVARASYDVKVGDILGITMGRRTLEVEVLNVTEYAKKENAAENYRVIGEKELPKEEPTE
ncbi:MAG: RNA-binding S4 domain-containing protein [Ruminococcus sp.]|nr:RNA-binding S4 domain-containing protein [Ruminococcus sp.]